MGSCHLHDRGLRRTAADRSALRTPSRASAPAPGCAAAARGRGGRRRARLASARRPSARALARPARARHAADRAGRGGACGTAAAAARPARSPRSGPATQSRSAGLRVRAVPARHDGRRLPVGPHRSPALGYVIEGAARTYFAGDTGLFEGMAQRRRTGGRGAAPGRRLGPLPGARPPGRGARGRGAGPPWERSRRCRCTTERTGRSAWTGCGRTSSTPPARSSYGMRRGSRRRRRCTGSGTARACVWGPRGDRGQALEAGRRRCRRRRPSRPSATRRCSCWWPSARWCRWCPRGRWCRRPRWWPSTRRPGSRCCCVFGVGAARGVPRRCRAVLAGAARGALEERLALAGGAARAGPRRTTWNRPGASWTSTAWWSWCCPAWCRPGGFR